MTGDMVDAWLALMAMGSDLLLLWFVASSWTDRDCSSDTARGRWATSSSQEFPFPASDVGGISIFTEELGVVVGLELATLLDSDEAEEDGEPKNLSLSLCRQDGLEAEVFLFDAIAASWITSYLSQVI